MPSTSLPDIMPLFESTLHIYRKTIKRLRPAHIAIHRLMSLVLLPALERKHNFQTIRDDPFWFRLELLTNRHETETVQLLRQLIKPGMVALDVGAHVGYYTRLLSHLVGETGRVIAFEPHPHSHQLLRHNTRDQPNVIALQAAATETEGSAELYDYLMMSGSGSLHYDESLAHKQRAQMEPGDIAPRRRHDSPMRQFHVDTITIDACLQKLGITHVDIVKMDIEGAELSALRGMQATIKASPNIKLIMEYNPGALQACGHNPQAALSEAMNMGFTRLAAIETNAKLHDWRDPILLAQETARMLDSMRVVNLLFER